MKRLYLLRHAKSSWSDSDLADFDRPLNQRGLRSAPFMGGLIAERKLVPELIVSSPARRARDTAELVGGNCGHAFELRFDERVYEASPQTLVQVTAGIEDTFGSTMIVGHNPGIEAFINFLTGRTEAMPTAALAIIDLAVKRWSLISAGCGTLVEIVRPRDQLAN